MSSVKPGHAAGAQHHLSASASQLRLRRDERTGRGRDGGADAVPLLSVTRHLLARAMHLAVLAASECPPPPNCDFCLKSSNLRLKRRVFSPGSHRRLGGAGGPGREGLLATGGARKLCKFLPVWVFLPPTPRLIISFT